MQVHQTHTLLLTRPVLASKQFGERLTGAKIVIAPLMEIVGMGAEVPLDGVQGLILTSQAVVPFLPQTGLPAFCVGPRTTEAARVAGLQADCIGQDADTLIQALLEQPPKAPLLHLHGTHTRGDIAQRLTDQGLNTQSTPIYDQRRVPPSPALYRALEEPGLIVPLFSPRSAKLFAKAAPRLPRDAVLLALSAAVAEALPENLLAHTRIARAPTGEEMLKLLLPLGVKQISP